MVNPASTAMRISGWKAVEYRMALWLVRRYSRLSPDRRLASRSSALNDLMVAMPPSALVRVSPSRPPAERTSA